MFQVWPAEGANYNYSAVIVLHFVFYRMKLLAQKECWYKTNMTSYIYNTSTSQWQNHQWFPVFFFFGLAHPVEANDVSILLLHHSNEVLFFKLVVWTEGQWQKKNDRARLLEIVYVTDQKWCHKALQFMTLLGNKWCHKVWVSDNVSRVKELIILVKCVAIKAAGYEDYDQLLKQRNRGMLLVCDDYFWSLRKVKMMLIVAC